MKHLTAFLSVLFALAACGGDTISATETGVGPGGGPGAPDVSSSTGTEDTGDDGGDTDSVMHDMSWDDATDTDTDTDQGDGVGDGDGDGGECDEETLGFMYACILAGSDELDTPENTCDEATPGCGYQQCTGSYYDDYYGALAGVREYCAAAYPPCAEFAQVSYNECLAGCYEDLATCDDGTDCLSCAGEMGFCIGDCEP